MFPRLSIIGLALLAVPGLGRAEAAACAPDKLARILAPASPDATAVEVDCSVKLDAAAVITKQVTLRGERASGVVFDCNGATLRKPADSSAWLRLLVISQRSVGKDGQVRWLAPAEVTVRNCHIEGGVRVQGMGINGEDPNLTDSSRQAGHTARVQAAAPHDISLVDNQIVAAGLIPIYFSPGVHHSRLEGNRIGGYSDSVALYLDAESADNVIKNNVFDVETRGKDNLESQAVGTLAFLSRQIGVTAWQDNIQLQREQIAVDGSAGNLIVGNRFQRLDHGGIFLYRNCGEGGNIRHQAPTGNQIVNNVFYYQDFDGHIPAVWLGSRHGDRSYCDLDRGYPFGSSASDLDFADGNFVAQNQFYKFEPARIVRDDGSGNRLVANSRVDSAVKRGSGCLLENHPPDSLLVDRATVRQVVGEGQPECMVRRQTCLDGELRLVERACVAKR